MENKGLFYLGRRYSREDKTDPLLFDPSHLTTHAVCLGMTGSGKTGLGIALLEEAALKGIPSIIVDPKGDMGNLLLAFPALQASDFLPWVDETDAAKKGETKEEYAAEIAKVWEEGLQQWGEDKARIQVFKDAVDARIYTPASKAGIPLSILNSFTAPSKDIIADEGMYRERLVSTTSGLLGLLGIKADPIQSREHILISSILDNAWKNGKDLDLPQLILAIQKPPFEKIGIFDTETFFPGKERLSLAMSLNNLLASPVFQGWMEGEPLDAQNLLYTKEGKPSLSVITIAHLSDSERMFFVTLLLNELISWMRKQPGTSSLRAIFYMDEVFGFFPPIASPASKTPMLTLLKQARAFGLGIVLSTQNPVDLDYKGLSNCGTWFIGRLQTDNDRSKVLEGIASAGRQSWNAKEAADLLSSCKKRMFFLRSIHLPDPLVFETRWTLSYLSGPLTLPQIKEIMQGKGEQIVKPAKAASELNARPAVSLEEYFLAKGAGQLQPRILGIAKLHYVDAKSRVDTWVACALAAQLSSDRAKVDWEQAEKITYNLADLKREAPLGSTLGEIPSLFLQSKNYPLFGKALCEFLYQTQTLTLYFCEDAKSYSQPNESKEDFLSRITQTLNEKKMGEVRKVQEKYDKKLSVLNEKLQKAIQKAEVQKSQVSRQKLDTYISFGTTLLGTLFGKKVSKGSISEMGTSIRRAGRIGKEQEEAAKSEESVEGIRQEIQTLEMEKQNAILPLARFSDANLIEIRIRPRKGDIALDKLALLWVG